MFSGLWCGDPQVAVMPGGYYNGSRMRDVKNLLSFCLRDGDGGAARHRAGAGWASMKYSSLALCGALFFARELPAFGADVISIWGGARGTIVLKSDGTVWTWGANFSGKLGIGVSSTTLGRALVPSEVHGPGDAGYLNSIKAIMGGEVHNVALKTDGTVWAWGNNVFSQLGNGTTNEAHVPTQVSGLSSVVKLGGRGYHTLAIEGDGSVWGWGWNSNGELGNGTTNA